VTDLTRNNIAACQIHKRQPKHIYTPELESGLVIFEKRSYASVKQSLRRVLSSCAPKAFLTILPETSIPIELIPFLREQAVKHKTIIIAGLEHTVKWLPSGSRDINFQTGAYTVENSLIVVWPDLNKAVHYGKKNFPAIVKAHSVVEQIERNPEPEFLIVSLKTPDGKEINVWPILCSDFLELTSGNLISRAELDRTILEQDVDLIAVLSHTHRADTFRNTMVQLVAGGQQRPLFTNIVFVNLAYYGGSLCLAYTDREMLRSSTENSEFWKDRIIPKDEESCCLFPDWHSAFDEAQKARRA
jgi:hypothetical protein